MERGDRPFVEEVRRVLDERGMSQRALARRLGVSSSHLSRVLRGVDYKTPSIDLMERIAEVLELRPETFTEFREAKVVELVRADEALCNDIYERHFARPRRRR